MKMPSPQELMRGLSNDRPKGLAARNANSNGVEAERSGGAILDEMLNTYAECKSYSDSGSAITKTVTKGAKGKSGDQVDEKPFTTAFVRPGRLRFEYKDLSGIVDGKPTRYILWTDGDEVKVWQRGQSQVQKKGSLEMAIGGFTGISGRSAATVPSMLMGFNWGEPAWARRTANARIGHARWIRLSSHQIQLWRTDRHGVDR